MSQYREEEIHESTAEKCQECFAPLEANGTCQACFSKERKREKAYEARADPLNKKLYGTDLFGEADVPTEDRGFLSAKFGVPPFSVLNTRDAWWQQRKRNWLSMGIQSEVGRGGELHAGAVVNVKEGDEWKGGRSAWQNAGTSIFDPVLCELVYRWFSPKGGTILDPFAGGSVRGVVAANLGRNYWGCELRRVQVEANRKQWEEIGAKEGARVFWACGDSTVEIAKQAPEADFVFSCPPYGDLEVYSDHPADLSGMDYPEFMAGMHLVIAACFEKLKRDRFACFVVGEFRDKAGHYHNFVGDTVASFQAAGFRYYNEAVLITPVGSLPVRAGRQFQAGRKLGKTHQNVIVFVKGSGKAATDHITEREE